MMTTFEFTIIASGLNPEAEDFETRFYDAGCDDATIAFQKGYIIVDFAREAQSIDEAIASAVANVLSAGATVEHIEPDPLVSLSDIAGRTNMSRAAMTNYAKGDRGKGFPAPAAKITSDSPLWDWSEVAHWLFTNGKIAADEAIIALAVKEANELIHDGSTDLAKDLKAEVTAYRERIAA